MPIENNVMSKELKQLTDVISILGLRNCVFLNFLMLSAELDCRHNFVRSRARLIVLFDLLLKCIIVLMLVHESLGL